MPKPVNSLTDIKLKDSNSEEFLEQILEEAKPFLKKSLLEWLRKQSSDSQKEKVTDDAFKLSFDEFMRLSEQEQRKWRHQILKEKKYWLNNQIISNKAEWILVLGGKVEIASTTLDNFPTKEEIYQKAKSKGFAPFIFVKDPLMEESTSDVSQVSWSSVAVHDFYPTIKIFVGMENWSDEKLINEEYGIIADFDTGSPVIVLNREDLIKRHIYDKNEIEISEIHLGRPYDYFLPKLKIGVRTSTYSIKSKALRVRSVLNWKESPFCLINPNRTGLIGRNLLLELALHVILKGDERSTQILK